MEKLKRHPIKKSPSFLPEAYGITKVALYDVVWRYPDINPVAVGELNFALEQKALSSTLLDIEDRIHLEEQLANQKTRNLTAADLQTALTVFDSLPKIMPVSKAERGVIRDALLARQTKLAQQTVSISEKAPALTPQTGIPPQVSNKQLPLSSEKRGWLEKNIINYISDESSLLIGVYGFGAFGYGLIAKDTASLTYISYGAWVALGAMAIDWSYHRFIKRSPAIIVKHNQLIDDTGKLPKLKSDF